MNATMKFSYMLYGGSLVAVATIIDIVSPQTGRNYRFGKITCTGLIIADENGIERATLETLGVFVYDGHTKLGANSYPDGVVGREE